MHIRVLTKKLFCVLLSLVIVLPMMAMADPDGIDSEEDYNHDLDVFLAALDEEYEGTGNLEVYEEDEDSDILTPDEADSIVIEDVTEVPTATEEVAEEEESDAEYKTNDAGVIAFVQRLYLYVMDREAPSNGTGVLYWANKILDGSESGGSVARQFFNSVEFKNRNVSNEKYVAILYRTFFAREPVGGGYNYWLLQLDDGKSRQFLLDNFIKSNEWKDFCDSYGIESGAPTPTPTSTPTPTATPTPPNFGTGIEGFVNRLYYYCFGRMNTAGSENYWVKALANNEINGSQVTKNFFYSREFTEIRSNLSDAEVVNVFYRVFLNRSGEGTGANYYIGLLNEEDGFDKVYRTFVASKEFFDICEAYGIDAGVYAIPTVEPQAIRWMQMNSYYLNRFNEERNLTPHRTYLSHNVQGATTVTRSVTISDREWQIVDEFARTHFSPYWTPGEKIGYTMWYINYYFSYGYIPNCGYAEAALVRHQGQCAQYNGAITILMCYLGFDASEIMGYRGTSMSNKWQHFWTEVTINGVTYMNETGEGSWYVVCHLYSETSKYIKNGVVMGKR